MSVKGGSTYIHDAKRQLLAYVVKIGLPTVTKRLKNLLSQLNAFIHIIIRKIMVYRSPAMTFATRQGRQLVAVFALLFVQVGKLRKFLEYLIIHALKSMTVNNRTPEPLAAQTSHKKTLALQFLSTR